MEANVTLSATPQAHALLRRALLVEDDVLMEPIWKAILSLIDPQVTLEWVTSQSAAQRAIERRRLAGEEFDLIISDIFLSGCKTGIDLWSENCSEKAAFILTSAVSQEKVVRLFGGENCPAFIGKPLDLDTCVDTVRSVLEAAAQR